MEDRETEIGGDDSSNPPKATADLPSSDWPEICVSAGLRQNPDEG
jgi:hypothetical protein